MSVVRSYLGYYTGSHQNSAVKRLWAGIVLGWVTSREVPVPHPHLLAFWPFADRKNPENRNVKRLFRSQTLPAISVGSSHSLPRHTRRYLPTCLRRPTPHATHSSSLWLLRVSCVRARARGSCCVARGRTLSRASTGYVPSTPAWTKHTPFKLVPYVDYLTYS